MKRIVIILSLLIAAFDVCGQKLTVEKMEVAPMDLSASTQPRNDRNGNPCALVKVQLATPGASFEGNVIGDTEFKKGEYWVYMSEGSYMLNIKHSSFLPLFVNFQDYGIKRVESKVTYVLTLVMPQGGPVPIDDGMRYLAMTVVPADGAQVKIDGRPQSLSNGSLSLLLPPGQHTYLVESAGYAPQQGTFTIAGEKVTLPIRLESTKATLSVSCATTGVDIYVNEQREGTGSWTGTLQPGIYRIEGRKQGYRTAIQTVTLAERDDKRVELPELQPIVGNISVDYQPINAEVWLDGKKLGTSPDVFRNIIIGTHQLELRMDGYLADTKTITVEEGKTLSLTGTMTPKPKDEFEGKTASEISDIAEDYYWGNNGKTQDYAMAVKWARKAAELGNSLGQFRLGCCYDAGWGVTQDYAEAVKWYRKAADQGYAEAQNNLGLCYKNGHGVTQDYAEAVKWYRKAANQGDADAQNNLGVCYKKGQGVTQDYAEAVKWYRKSADQGNAVAQNNLGYCYYKGQGVTQDYAEAVKWWRKAADQGHAGAQCNLGYCYYNGKGVTQDRNKAKELWRKAAAQGEQLAKDNLKKLFNENY